MIQTLCATMKMDYETAKNLILKEGTSVEGIYVCVRMGDDPGHDRMMRLVEAIDVLIANEDLSAPIDRAIAYSIAVILHETEVQSTSWKEDRQWREGGFFEDMIELQDKAFEYLQGSLDFDEPE